MLRRLILLATSALTAFGCAPEQTAAPASSSEGELLGGRYTFERPEVGSINTGGSCTATLFGSARTVITAAHCVDFANRGVGNHGTFTLEPRPGQVYRYTIQQQVVFGGPSDPSSTDVALLQLSEAVPSSVARPAPPALSAIPRGARMTIYGYGCQARGGGGAFGKQSIEYGWGSNTFNLCPGDSGGPTMTESGAVVRVNSAYIISSGMDLFGEIPPFADAILRYVEAWRGDSALVWEGSAPADPVDPADPADPSDPPPSDPPPSDPPPSDPPPSDPPSGHPPGSVGARCAAHADCGSCIADTYCGWCGGCVGLHLDPWGNIAGNGCSTPVEIWSCPWPGSTPSDPPPPTEPPPSTPPPASPPGADCGAWSGAYDFECAAEANVFARCTAAGVELVYCPPGTFCTPGSSHFSCAFGY